MQGVTDCGMDRLVFWVESSAAVPMSVESNKYTDKYFGASAAAFDEAVREISVVCIIITGKSWLGLIT